jgi:hypothetical protein
MFRRIPRLSKRAPLITLVVVVAALAFPPVGWQQPESGIRFRYPDNHDAGYVSLDEPKIVDLFHLDLSAYQFPADFPLTIDGSAVYLKALYNTRQILVPTDFSLSHNCTPSPDLKKLLCGSPANADILDLPAEQQDAAIGALQEHLVSHPEFFVITPGIPQIYAIPEGRCRNCRFDYRTACRWASASRIYCITGHGTGVWGTSLFDLESRSYVELPRDGDNIVDDSLFGKGFIHFDSTYPFTLELFDLSKTMVYQGKVEDWTASEDTVAFVGPCDKGSYCMHRLQFDDGGLRTSREQVLETSWTPIHTGGYIARAGDEYLVTTDENVFILSEATLQVRRALKHGEADTALHRNNNLMVTGSGFSPLEVTFGATAFDLRKCQTRLDDSCKIQTWNPVHKPDADNPSFHYVRRHIYYSPIESPDLMFSIDEDLSRLTISSLEDWKDYSFQLIGIPKLVTTSTDGHFLLIATVPDDNTSLQDARFHLIDLKTMRPDPREMVMGKNLFLVWANAL